MIEIRNRKKFPVQVVVRSRRAPKSFTTLNVPGVGAGHNVALIDDELMTEYVGRAEKMGLISVRHVKNKLPKGE